MVVADPSLASQFTAARCKYTTSESSSLQRTNTQIKGHPGNGESCLVVMSYQSLEDRIVKNHFTQVSKSKTPLQLPVELPDSAASYKLLISGSQGADEDEQGINPRSQSMRLRAIERVAA